MRTQEPEYQLHRLSELKDYEISPNNPDVRGWTLIGLDGERLGEVDDLIVDLEAGKVRYLDVVLDKDVASGTDDHVLIPIGAARLHKNNNNVLVERLSHAEIMRYPRFNGREITREYEQSLWQSMGIRQHAGSVAATDEATMGAVDQTASRERISHMRSELETRVEAQRKAQSDLHQNRRALILPEQPNAQSAPKPAQSRAVGAFQTDYSGYSREELEDALQLALAERDVAMKERDIARAERDILRLERDGRNRRAVYTHEHFDESKFYENRRQQDRPDNTGRPGQPLR